jgi:ketosteroid isomerase-like protein
MTDRAALDDWTRRYVHAWESNDPREIGDLFTEGAEYFTAPFREPWRGREEIVRGWLGRKDEPGTWTFEFEVVGVDGDTGFVQGRTEYSAGKENFVNLWLVRLHGDGRATEFVEWWMDPDA